MAKILGNVLLTGVSGEIGKQIVIRQTKRGGVMAISPKSTSKPATDAQIAHRAKFALAVQFAKGAKDLPE